MFHNDLMTRELNNTDPHVREVIEMDRAIRNFEDQIFQKKNELQILESNVAILRRVRFQLRKEIDNRKLLDEYNRLRYVCGLSRKT